jgi:hypothetical protein
LSASKAMRRFTARRSSSLISSQRLTSSKVRRQLRQTSSPSTVVQWPMQGESEVISRGMSVACMGRDYTGCVASSNRVNQFMASSRDAPHISAEGCSPPQKGGRCGRPNTLQRNSSSSCTHGTPAGLPFGMPGRGEVMEGAMQQAAQEGRQFMGRDYICASPSEADLVGHK